MEGVEAFKPTIKSAIMYEEITGKQFFSTERSDEDALTLMYCVYACTVNEVSMAAFITMMQNKKFASGIAAKWAHYERFMRPFEEREQKNGGEEAAKGGNADISMKEVAQILVFKYGLNPDYVFNKVELWEVNYLIKIGEQAYRDKAEETRLWNYLQIIPHLDPKKAKNMSAEKFFPFPWEDNVSTKEGRKKVLEREEGRMKKTIGMHLDI